MFKLLLENVAEARQPERQTDVGEKQVLVKQTSKQSWALRGIFEFVQ